MSLQFTCLSWKLSCLVVHSACLLAAALRLSSVLQSGVARTLICLARGLLNPWSVVSFCPHSVTERGKALASPHRAGSTKRDVYMPRPCMRPTPSAAWRMLGSASPCALWQLFLLFLLVFAQGWGCFLWPAIAPGGGLRALLGLCFHLLDKHRLPLTPFTVQLVKMLPGCLEEGHWGSGQRASSPKMTTADSRGRWTSPPASDGQRHGDSPGWGLQRGLQFNSPGKCVLHELLQTSLVGTLQHLETGNFTVGCTERSCFYLCEARGFLCYILGAPGAGLGVT